MEATTTDRTEIGRKRKAARVISGLKQAELADAAGLSSATVSSAEAGDEISESSIRKLAAALGIPACEYLG